MIVLVGQTISLQPSTILIANGGGGGAGNDTSGTMAMNGQDPQISSALNPAQGGTGPAGPGGNGYAGGTAATDGTANTTAAGGGGGGAGFILSNHALTTGAVSPAATVMP
jgi:hypothetical protein